jgi:hypothetical protein
MMRGKVELGGVPSSVHPGKIAIHHVFARTESEARETIRVALVKMFSVNTQIPHDANRFFEKWIDVKRANHARVAWANSTLLEYIVFVYLTSEAFLKKVVDVIDEQKIPSLEGAPKEMRVSGHKIQFIKCRRCGRRGHSLSECVDYCLRIETASLLHQISPALIKLLKDKTKAQRS